MRPKKNYETSYLDLKTMTFFKIIENIYVFKIKYNEIYW